RKLRGKVDHAEVADLESWESPSRFDRVACAGVLDFVTEPERAFANLARLVSSSGRLVVMAPMQGPWSMAYPPEKALSGLKVNLSTVEWFEEQGRRNGLELIRQRRALPFNAVLAFERL